MHNSTARPQKNRGQKSKDFQKTTSKKIKTLNLESIKQSGGKPWEEQVKLLRRGEKCGCMKEVIALMVEYRQSGHLADLQGLWFRCKGGDHARNHHHALTAVWEGKWVVEIHEVPDSLVDENLILPIVKSA